MMYRMLIRRDTRGVLPLPAALTPKTYPLAWVSIPAWQINVCGAGAKSLILPWKACLRTRWICRE